MGPRFCGANHSNAMEKRYILLCTDYVRKWVKAKSLFQATEKAVVYFLFEVILTHFGVPRYFFTNQGA